MRVKVTVYYGDNERAITRTSRSIPLASAEDDPDTFGEAEDYLAEYVLEPLSLDGYELIDDEEESDEVGESLLAAWVLDESFEDRQDALDVLEEILDEINNVLSEIE